MDAATDAEVMFGVVVGAVIVVVVIQWIDIGFQEWVVMHRSRDS